MKIYHLKDSLAVFGAEVKTFPEGIGEAFENLAKKLPDGLARAYYGISYFDEEGRIIYHAAVEQKYEGEAERYNFTGYIIEKGEYLTVPLKDWRKKTGSIKDIFHEMMKDRRVSNNSNCVEWYKDNDEMLCMIRIEPVKENIGL